MNYYTADLHFFDEFILQVCSRPFETVLRMNETIVRNWNSVVMKNDEAYILGDIFPCKPHKGDFERVLSAIVQLNGRKTLIIGNHDEPFVAQLCAAGVFSDLCHIKRIFDDTQEIVLCHYPLMTWQNDEGGSVHLYGHIHNKALPDISNYFSKRKAYNAGCDVNNFCPRSLKDIQGDKQICQKSITL